MPVTEVFRRHGVDLHKGKCCCPFHVEDTPSLSVYAQGRKWKCFGCGQGGNVIDAVMLFDGLDFMQALQALDADYKLDLFADGNDTVVVRKPRISAHTIAANELFRLKQIREDALQGFYYYNSILRRYKSPEFRSKAEESEFWEAVTLREKCEQVYEELTDISL